MTAEGDKYKGVVAISKSEMSVFGKNIAPLRARNKLFSETTAAVSYGQNGSKRYIDS